VKIYDKPASGVVRVVLGWGYFNGIPGQPLAQFCNFAPACFFKGNFGQK
jgi:hypothetical protein